MGLYRNINRNLQLPMQSVPITTSLVSLNHAHGEVLDTTLCDKVCQSLVAGRWFSPVSSTNKADSHDITEILWKVASNIITLTLILHCRKSQNIVLEVKKKEGSRTM